MVGSLVRFKKDEKDIWWADYWGAMGIVTEVFEQQYGLGDHSKRLFYRVRWITSVSDIHVEYRQLWGTPANPLVEESVMRASYFEILNEVKPDYNDDKK